LLDDAAAPNEFALQEMGKIIQGKIGRRQSRDLEIEISFFEALSHRDPDNVELLQLLGDDLSDAARYADGLKVDERLVALRPLDANIRFNYACSLALTGALDQSCIELETAFNLGYRDVRWLQEDPDLDALRKHPGYRKIRARIRALDKDKDKDADTSGTVAEA
jgi:hypothetical protein